MLGVVISFVTFVRFVVPSVTAEVGVLVTGTRVPVVFGRFVDVSFDVSEVFVENIVAF